MTAATVGALVVVAVDPAEPPAQALDLAGAVLDLPVDPVGGVDRLPGVDVPKQGPDGNARVSGGSHGPSVPPTV